MSKLSINSIPVDLFMKYFNETNLKENIDYVMDQEKLKPHVIKSLTLGFDSPAFSNEINTDIESDDYSVNDLNSITDKEIVIDEDDITGLAMLTTPSYYDSQDFLSSLGIDVFDVNSQGGSIYVKKIERGVSDEGVKPIFKLYPDDLIDETFYPFYITYPKKYEGIDGSSTHTNVNYRRVQIFMDGEEQYNLDNIIKDDKGELVNKKFTMRVWNTIAVSAEKKDDRYYFIEGPEFVSDITKDNTNDYYTDYTIEAGYMYCLNNNKNEMDIEVLTNSRFLLNGTLDSGTSNEGGDTVISCIEKNNRLPENFFAIFEHPAKTTRKVNNSGQFLTRDATGQEIPVTNYVSKMEKFANAVRKGFYALHGERQPEEKVEPYRVGGLFDGSGSAAKLYWYAPNVQQDKIKLVNTDVTLFMSDGDIVGIYTKDGDNRSITAINGDNVSKKEYYYYVEGVVNADDNSIISVTEREKTVVTGTDKENDGVHTYAEPKVLYVKDIIKNEDGTYTLDFEKINIVYEKVSNEIYDNLILGTADNIGTGENAGTDKVINIDTEYSKISSDPTIYNIADDFVSDVVEVDLIYTDDDALTDNNSETAANRNFYISKADQNKLKTTEKNYIKANLVNVDVLTIGGYDVSSFGLKVDLSNMVITFDEKPSEETRMYSRLRSAYVSEPGVAVNTETSNGSTSNIYNEGDILKFNHGINMHGLIYSSYNENNFKYTDPKTHKEVNGIRIYSELNNRNENEYYIAIPIIYHKDATNLYDDDDTDTKIRKSKEYAEWGFLTESDSVSSPISFNLTKKIGDRTDHFSLHLGIDDAYTAYGAIDNHKSFENGKIIKNNVTVKETEFKKGLPPGVVVSRGGEESVIWNPEDIWRHDTNGNVYKEYNPGILKTVIPNKHTITNGYIDKNKDYHAPDDDYPAVYREATSVKRCLKGTDERPDNFDSKTEYLPMRENIFEEQDPVTIRKKILEVNNKNNRVDEIIISRYGYKSYKLDSYDTSVNPDKKLNEQVVNTSTLDVQSWSYVKSDLQISTLKGTDGEAFVITANDAYIDAYGTNDFTSPYRYRYHGYILPESIWHRFEDQADYYCDNGKYKKLFIPAVWKYESVDSKVFTDEEFEISDLYTSDDKGSQRPPADIKDILKSEGNGEDGLIKSETRKKSCALQYNYGYFKIKVGLSPLTMTKENLDPRKEVPVTRKIGTTYKTKTDDDGSDKKITNIVLNNVTLRDLISDESILKTTKDGKEEYKGNIDDDTKLIPFTSLTESTEDKTCDILSVNMQNIYRSIYVTRGEANVDNPDDSFKTLCEGAKEFYRKTPIILLNPTGEVTEKTSVYNKYKRAVIDECKYNVYQQYLVPSIEKLEKDYLLEGKDPVDTEKYSITTAAKAIIATQDTNYTNPNVIIREVVDIPTNDIGGMDTTINASDERILRMLDREKNPIAENYPFSSPYVESLEEIKARNAAAGNLNWYKYSNATGDYVQSPFYDMLKDVSAQTLRYDISTNNTILKPKANYTDNSLIENHTRILGMGDIIVPVDNKKEKQYQTITGDSGGKVILSKEEYIDTYVTDDSGADINYNPSSPYVRILEYEKYPLNEIRNKIMNQLSNPELITAFDGVKTRVSNFFDIPEKDNKVNYKTKYERFGSYVNVSLAAMFSEPDQDKVKRVYDQYIGNILSEDKDNVYDKNKDNILESRLYDDITEKKVYVVIDENKSTVCKDMIETLKDITITSDNKKYKWVIL